MKLNYLDIENIERSTGDVEYHPLKPFLPEGCKVLFLGSFPPQRKRWAKGFDFFYPNFINDHWRIEGLIFFGDKNHFVDVENKTFKLPEIVQFLKEKGIGFYDTATCVRRLKDNADDNFLEIVEGTDVFGLLRQMPECKTIVTTGGKASEELQAYFKSHGIVVDIPKVGECVFINDNDTLRYDNDNQIESKVSLCWWRMPSSSRAYPMKLEKKAEYYKRLFD